MDQVIALILFAVLTWLNECVDELGIELNTFTAQLEFFYKVGSEERLDGDLLGKQKKWEDQLD